MEVITGDLSPNSSNNETVPKSSPVPMALLQVQFVQQGDSIYKVLVPQNNTADTASNPINPIICQVHSKSEFINFYNKNYESNDTPVVTSFVNLSEKFKTVKSIVRLPDKVEQKQCENDLVSGKRKQDFDTSEKKVSIPEQVGLSFVSNVFTPNVSPEARKKPTILSLKRNDDQVKLEEESVLNTKIPIPRLLREISKPKEEVKFRLSNGILMMVTSSNQTAGNMTKPIDKIATMQEKPGVSEASQVINISHNMISSAVPMSIRTLQTGSYPKTVSFIRLPLPDSATVAVTNNECSDAIGSNSVPLKILNDKNVSILPDSTPVVNSKVASALPGSNSGPIASVKNKFVSLPGKKSILVDNKSSENVLKVNSAPVSIQSKEVTTKITSSTVAISNSKTSTGLLRPLSVPVSIANDKGPANLIRQTSAPVAAVNKISSGLLNAVVTLANNNSSTTSPALNTVMNNKDFTTVLNSQNRIIYVKQGNTMIPLGVAQQKLTNQDPKPIQKPSVPHITPQIINVASLSKQRKTFGPVRSKYPGNSKLSSPTASKITYENIRAKEIKLNVINKEPNRVSLINSPQSVQAIQLPQSAVELSQLKVDVENQPKTDNKINPNHFMFMSNGKCFLVVPHSKPGEEGPKQESAQLDPKTLESFTKILTNKLKSEDQIKSNAQKEVTNGENDTNLSIENCNISTEVISSNAGVCESPRENDSACEVENASPEASDSESFDPYLSLEPEVTFTEGSEPLRIERPDTEVTTIISSDSSYKTADSSSESSSSDEEYQPFVRRTTKAKPRRKRVFVRQKPKPIIIKKKESFESSPDSSSDSAPSKKFKSPTIISVMSINQIDFENADAPQSKIDLPKEAIRPQDITIEAIEDLKV